MSRKKLIMLGMVVGAITGGYLAALFGLDGLMVSLLGSFIGGIIGIWLSYHRYRLLAVYGILNGLMSVIIWNGIALVLGCGMFYAKMNWGR